MNIRDISTKGMMIDPKDVKATSRFYELIGHKGVKLNVDIDCFVRYVLLMYDSNSPLIASVDDYWERKMNALEAGGFKVKNDRLEDSVEKIALGENEKANDLIIDFLIAVAKPQWTYIVFLNESLVRYTRQSVKTEKISPSDVTAAAGLYSKLGEAVKDWLYAKNDRDETTTFRERLYYRVSKELMKKSFPRIHWEPIKHGWAKCVEYCSKLDTRADGPWHSSDVKIPACNLDPKKGIIDPLDGANLYVWQCWVEHILKTRPDDRTVYWFWEARGNCGKSAMVKHIYLKYWDKVVIATGKGNDVRNQVNRHVNGDPNKGIDGKPLEIALLDFSRSIEDFVSYETIEQIKNGLLYSGKYEGGVCCFNTPHVICFANFEPDVSKLSADRWVIIEIDDNMMLLDDYEEIDHDVFSCEPPARSVSASSSLHQESDSIKDDPLSGLSPC